jgi:hypothetical protein
MVAQDRIERDLILTNKRASAIVLVPIRAKRKEFPDGYDKNAKFSVKMLVSFTPSSYELDAHASRSRARFFDGSAQKDRRSHRTTDPSANVRRDCRTCAANELSQNPANATWKEEPAARRTKPITSLPSSGPFS